MSNLRHWLWLSTRGPAPGMYAARVLESVDDVGAWHASIDGSDAGFHLGAHAALQIRQHVA